MPNGQVQARIQFLCFLSLFLLVCCSRPQRQHQPSSFFYHLHPTPTGVLLTWMEPEPLLSLRDAHVIYYDMYIIHMMQRQFNLASLETYLILRLHPAGLSHWGRDGCAWADLSRAQRSCRRYLSGAKLGSACPSCACEISFTPKTSCICELSFAPDTSCQDPPAQIPVYVLCYPSHVSRARGLLLC